MAAKASLDSFDRKILRLLQEDATARRRRCRQEGRPVDDAVLAADPETRGRGRHQAARGHARPRQDQCPRHRLRFDPHQSHSHEWLRRFSEVIQEFPEVIEFYRMSGDVDYLLRVVVPDIAAYDAFYKRLIAKIEIRDVSSSFAMEQIKYTTELPLTYLP